MLHWLQSLLAHHGYWIVFLAVFFNNLGLPIPGDMTILWAGFLGQRGDLSLWAVIAAGTAGCFLGGDGAYGIGRGFGHHVLKKIRWLQVEPQRVEHVEHFFKSYGAKAVFLARFVALLHPVTGLLAGMGKTPWRPFLFYNLAGSAAYAALYALGGYFFGQKWEAFKTWMGPIALYVFLLVLALLLLGWFLRRSIRALFAGLSPKK